MKQLIWFHNSIVASIPACYAGDLGSISSGGDLSFLGNKHAPLTALVQCHPLRYVKLSHHFSRFSYVRYVLSSMTTVSIISEEAKITFNYCTHKCLYIYIAVLVFQFVLIRHELYSTSIYTRLCFVYRSILFIQVQVSIKVIFDNQWTQYFNNIFNNHRSLKFILGFFSFFVTEGSKNEGN